MAIYIASRIGNDHVSIVNLFTREEYGVYTWEELEDATDQLSQVVYTRKQCLEKGDIIRIFVNNKEGRRVIGVVEEFTRTKYEEKF